MGLDEHRTDELRRAAEFGADFRSLMLRLAKEHEAHLDDEEGPERREVRRASAAAQFEREVENLIRRHSVDDSVAEYVRHVVRVGFEVAFDPMDPSVRLEQH